MPPKVKIYHNPRCSKSRATLALLEERGLRPDVILYLDGALMEADLKSILTALNAKPLDVMRKGEVAFKDLDLGAENISDGELIAAIIANPILLERPIVVVDNEKAAIGRPPENVLTILP